VNAEVKVEYTSYVSAVMLANVIEHLLAQDGHKTNLDVSNLC